jgi:hypothetical protein
MAAGGFDWKNCVAGMGLGMLVVWFMWAPDYWSLGAVGVLAIGCGAAGFYC